MEHSGGAKHRVETGLVGAFAQARALQRNVDAHEFSKSFAEHQSIDAAIRAFDADAVLPGAAAPEVGLIFSQGFQFLVVGERRYSFDDPVLHDASMSDRAILGYIHLYLRKVADGLRVPS